MKYSLHEKKESAFIANELDGLIDYFILFNEMNSEAEVFPINKIPSCLSKLTLDCDFYPREGTGMICIGLSDTTEPISFS